jgi:hypothetical protein
MKGLFYVLGTLCTVAAIVIIIALVIINYRAKLDVVSYFERAQVASDSGDMLKYLQLGKKGMEDRHATEGYAVYVFKTPTNDLALIYGAVKDLEQRLITVNAMDKSSVQYQTGMEDCRGILHDLMESESTSPHINPDILTWRLGGVMWLVVWLMISLVLGFLFFLAGYATDNY